MFAKLTPLQGPGLFTCGASSGNDSATSSTEVTLVSAPLASAISTSASSTSAIRPSTTSTTTIEASAIETSATVISVVETSVAVASGYGNSTGTATVARLPTLSVGTGISGPANTSSTLDETTCSGQTVTVYATSTGESGLRG